MTAFADPSFGTEEPTASLSLRKASLLMDSVFKNVSLACAVSVVVLIVSMFAVLAYAAAPAFKEMGWAFFTSTAWNPVTEHYGALPAIFGTVVTALLALIIALPIGLGIAFFLAEFVPERWSKKLRIPIELLAGIPSIVYGFWGLFVLAPLFQAHVQPFLINHLGGIPLIGALFEGPAYGVGIFTAGCILSIMILPFLAAFLTDVFNTVSPLLKESAYALGSTRWEVMRSIIVPSTGSSVIGGIMLALGRALGETMAVTFVIGNSHRLTTSILAPGTTISASLANEFNEATRDLHSAALLALGLILFAITFIILACGKGMILALNKRKGA
jgi:phosphate transport system permease protein